MLSHDQVRTVIEAMQRLSEPAPTRQPWSAQAAPAGVFTARRMAGHGRVHWQQYPEHRRRTRWLGWMPIPSAAWLWCWWIGLTSRDPENAGLDRFEQTSKRRRTSRQWPNRHPTAAGVRLRARAKRELRCHHWVRCHEVRLRLVVTVDDVRTIASRLPRSYEVYVRKQIKFRVGKIVYVAFSRDQTLMGVGFPKEWRSVTSMPSRTSSCCHRSRTCASTGCWHVWRRSTTTRCATWYSMPGGWWCPSAWRRRTTPGARAT